MAAARIDRKIVGWETAKAATPEVPPVDAATPEVPPVDATVPVPDGVGVRPEELEGVTYKIRTPQSDHALYVTINDRVAENGSRVPFEIFINSKNMENFAWIVALTRVISAVFRHGGDLRFLVEELRSVFDPRGGYYKRGGKYMPSLVAEIGECIEKHLVKIAAIQPREAPPAKGAVGNAYCPKCSQLSLVRLDGCDTCLECGYSKCG